MKVKWLGNTVFTAAKIVTCWHCHLQREVFFSFKNIVLYSILWASIIQNLLSFGHFSVECKQNLYVAGIRYASKHHTESTEFSPEVSEFCMLLVLWFDQALYRNYLHLENVAKNCQKMHVSKFCMLLVHTIKQASYRNHLVFKILWLLLALSDIQKDTESHDI